jgi:hypothetical protein
MLQLLTIPNNIIIIIPSINHPFKVPHLINQPKHLLIQQPHRLLILLLMKSQLLVGELQLRQLRLQFRDKQLVLAYALLERLNRKLLVAVGAIVKGRLLGNGEGGGLVLGEGEFDGAVRGDG